jgi:hypothetical protein
MQTFFILPYLMAFDPVVCGARRLLDQKARDKPVSVFTASWTLMRRQYPMVSNLTAINL